MIITLLRKPLEGCVADNALKHGCGSINIDATRIPHNEEIKVIKAQKTGNLVYSQSGRYEDTTELKPNGRWPANFILTHLEGCTSLGEDWACVEGCPTRELDQQSGHLKSGEMKAGNYQMWGKNGIYGEGKEHPATYYGDEGGASRFFKQFKKEND
jgi:hypothetical protein